EAFVARGKVLQGGCVDSPCMARALDEAPEFEGLHFGARLGAEQALAADRTDLQAAAPVRRRQHGYRAVYGEVGMTQPLLPFLQGQWSCQLHVLAVRQQ